MLLLHIDGKRARIYSSDLLVRCTWDAKLVA